MFSIVVKRTDESARMNSDWRTGSILRPDNRIEEMDSTELNVNEEKLAEMYTTVVRRNYSPSFRCGRSFALVPLYSETLGIHSGYICE